MSDGDGWEFNLVDSVCRWFESNNSGFDTDVLNEAMKEIPKRYTNPFLSDEENEQINLLNQELERSNIEDALTNNCKDDKLINSLAPSDFCEKETELYTNKNVMECDLPESLICYKEVAFHVKDICVDEGIAQGEQIFFYENNNKVLKPESLRCSTMEDYFMGPNLCSESNGKIDTGLPVHEPSNMNIGNNHDEVIKRKSYSSSVTQEVDADVPVSEPINDQDLQNSIPDYNEPSSDHMNIGYISNEVIEKKSDASFGTEEVDADLPNEPISDQDLQNLIPDYKECGSKEKDIDSNVPNKLKDMSNSDSNNGDGLSECTSDRLMFSSQTDTVPKAIENNGPDISSQPGEEQTISSRISSLQQGRPLPTLKSLLETIDQQACQTPAEKSSRPVENESSMDGNTTLNPNNPEPATSSNVHDIKTREHADAYSIEPHGATKLQDVGSDNVPRANMLHHGGEGESSFSVAGPISALETYSGSIAFSGSTSLRSDSSTTSTRSFAFPILQNEWNSSPVRMTKADRRQLPKHRGWRHGLLCCRF